jgi:threonine/homoserine/homoserine lactone efflux protein
LQVYFVLRVERTVRTPEYPRIGDLLSEIVPLAAAAAISPVVFMVQLSTLTGPRPLSRGAALLAGAAVVLIVLSTIGVLLGSTSFSTNDSAKAALNIVLGALLILVGLRALLKPPKPKATEPDSKPKSAGRSFMTGAAAMGTNVTSFALYIPALALIAGSDLPLGQRGLAALVILLITLSVAWVPLLAAAVIPGASTSLLPALGNWMTENDRWIQVILGFGFGIWLLIKGIQGL